MSLLILDNILKFINYWWFRYLMVTELYMVERWERVAIHVIIFLVFMLVWYFNSTVFLSLTGSILGIGRIDHNQLINNERIKYI